MCQCSKVQRHTVTPLSTFATLDARFYSVNLDIVGPLPPSKGFIYFLTCIDRFTCLPEAIPIANITMETVAQVFVNIWILRFGVPVTITTDCGSQFESGLWDSFMYPLVSSTLGSLLITQLQMDWLNVSTTN